MMLCIAIVVPDAVLFGRMKAASLSS